MANDSDSQRKKTKNKERGGGRKTIQSELAVLWWELEPGGCPWLEQHLEIGRVPLPFHPFFSSIPGLHKFRAPGRHDA
jgi:hypothetical protein